MFCVLRNAMKQVFKHCLRRGWVDGNLKLLRIDSAKKHIGVGERQRTAKTVTRRPRNGARAVRPDRKPPIAKIAYRSAAGCDSFNGQCGRDQPHAADGVFESILKIAVKSRHVSAGAAHVKADDAIKSRLTSNRSRTCNTARRTAEQTVARVVIRIAHQPACAGHYVQSRACA